MTNFKYIRHRLSDRLDLPEDTLGSAFRLQMIGNRIILSKCLKLLKYKSDEIIVLTKEANITFCGEHLKCLYFFEGTIEIAGDFCGIKFENR